MSEYFLKENTDIDPRELQDILVGFLGQTYGEVSRYDSNIISANPFLSPKKNEFERLAQQVIREATQPQSNKVQNQSPQVQPQPRQQQPRPNPVQNVVQEPPKSDPMQMEFSFDNSVTAITINNKLDDLEKRIKKLDNTLEKVLSLLESYETKNSQQDKLHSEIPFANL